MSDISVRKVDDGRFAVELAVDQTTTSHTVTVPAAMVEELGLDHVEPEALVRESMVFLLEREPPTSIMSEFALTDIQRYFNEYPDELKSRFSTG